MKIGTHNLGPNSFARTTLVRVNEHGLSFSQIHPRTGVESRVLLSPEQAQLLKDVLS